MMGIMNILIPQELNPMTKERDKAFKEASKRVSEDARRAKSRFEQSLLELEEMLAETKKENVHNGTNVATK